jgi:organic hydroperoxide reductase OsmC/OhrA
LARALQQRLAMKPYPHDYRVSVSAAPEGLVTLTCEGLPALETAPPEQFDGSGDRWSPETLFVGAVADCFALTFRAVARASNLAWTSLQASASGTLEQASGGARFTSIRIDASLAVPGGVEEARAVRFLEKAERGCLITRSLVCPTTLQARVVVGRS